MRSGHLVPLAVVALLLAGCASDEAPDEPVEDSPPVEIIEDGVDTEVEVSENLGFDEPDEG